MALCIIDFHVYFTGATRCHTKNLKKTSVSKKLISICNLQCFVKVAMLKKNTHGFEKLHRFFINFSWKNEPKSIKNRIKRWVQYKSMKTRSLGPLFGPRVDSGLFWGSQRGPKNYPKSTQSFQIKAQLAWGGPRELPEPILIDFSMILEWFLGPQMVNFETIWGAFWR